MPFDLLKVADAALLFALCYILYYTFQCKVVSGIIADENWAKATLTDWRAERTPCPTWYSRPSRRLVRRWRVEAWQRRCWEDRQQLDERSSLCRSRTQWTPTTTSLFIHTNYRVIQTSQLLPAYEKNVPKPVNKDKVFITFEWKSTKMLVLNILCMTICDFVMQLLYLKMPYWEISCRTCP